MKLIGAGWIPELEIYCERCRRMVAARKIANRSDLLDVADHYRYWDGRDDDGWGSHHRSKLCTGPASRRGITEGMEDPLAAFDDSPKIYEWTDELESKIALGAT